MKIKELTYGRVHNLGNYETQRLEVTCSIDDNESPEEVFNGAKSFVEAKLFGEVDDE